ncbi:MAG: hypothetical protein RLZZ127_919 [Planctomycetota bacterium]|jgi:hypothetical protein
MSPDLAQDRLRAWGSCAGAAVVAGLAIAAVWYGVDVPAALEQRDRERTRVAGLTGEPIDDRIQQQQEANAALAATISRLMDQTRFETARDFQVVSEGQRIEIEPGYRWKDRFLEVRQRVRDACRPGSIERSEYLGFPDATEIPPAAQVPAMLSMLQIVEKISLTIGGMQPFIERFDVKPGVPVDGGPGPDGQALLREHPVTLTVRGELEAVMKLLWRFAQILPVPDREARAYPLAIKGLVINSENVTARDGINQLTAVIELAAIEYRRLPGAAAAVPAAAPAGGSAAGTTRPGGARP